MVPKAGGAAAAAAAASPAPSDGVAVGSWKVACEPTERTRSSVRLSVPRDSSTSLSGPRTWIARHDGMLTVDDMAGR